MKLTLQSFLIQLANGIENPTDNIKSIGTWSGATKNRYTVYVEREDGTEYEINITKEE